MRGISRQEDRMWQMPRIAKEKIIRLPVPQSTTSASRKAMAIYDKPVRVLMKDMSDTFDIGSGHSFTRKQAIEWFATRYPKVKTGTITAHLYRLSTNAPSRVHYNPTPGDDDLFFSD